MSTINEIFKKLEIDVTIAQKGLLDSEECNGMNDEDPYEHVQRITSTINKLSDILEKDETILISVTHQKLLRTSFQIIVAVGTSPSLMPGVGLKMAKRCTYSANLEDDEKYKLIVLCADFFTRSFTVSILKNIICNLHLSDYLACLIQLAFAPLKEPGTYHNYVMTQSKYDRLITERRKFIVIYENLVQECFQPYLIKELLVLQSVTDPSAPKFLKMAVTKELSKRIMAPSGLLSFIRCFLENHGLDTGCDWKKIDAICRIVTAKHYILSDAEYLDNMCSQITEILTQHNTNTQYILIASACIFSLNSKYKQCETVKRLTHALLKKFDYINLLNNATTPDAVLMTSHEIENNLKILHVSLCIAEVDWPSDLWKNNMFILFMLGMKCEPSDELNGKIKSIIVKYLGTGIKSDDIQMFLFGVDRNFNIYVDVNDTGLVLKYAQKDISYSKENALKLFIEIFEQITCVNAIKDIFQSCLVLLIDVINKRSLNNKDSYGNLEDNNQVINDLDEKYAIILKLLMEISTSAKIVASLKNNPEIVLEFIEYFLIKTSEDPNEECILISLVLLNTVLANVKTKDSRSRFTNLKPFLEKMQYDNDSYVRILCEEAITMISEDIIRTPSALSKAIGNVFDKQLPVRAHGIIEITKLMESKDVETLAKKHYIFCLLQEQLKSADSYIYLSTINCIAALAVHCTEDVLHVLCNEFVSGVAPGNDVETKESINKSIEHRMKVGDIIVKTIRKLGERAVEHKAELLNTMLSACRDPEPMIRTSALSNLAEVALVIHYKMGSIIQEVLKCVWSILESDNAIECRRAAVMVIASLIKGLGKETLLNLKENLLPVYRTLKSLYDDPNEDHILKLHAQIGLEELNSIVAVILLNKIDVKHKLVLEDKT